MSNETLCTLHSSATPPTHILHNICPMIEKKNISHHPLPSPKNLHSLYRVCVAAWFVATEPQTRICSANRQSSCTHAIINSTRSLILSIYIYIYLNHLCILYIYIYYVCGRRLANHCPHFPNDVERHQYNLCNVGAARSELNSQYLSCQNQCFYMYVHT